LQDARVKPGEEAAINLMRNTAPQSGEELAAQMLALPASGFRRHALSIRHLYLSRQTIQTANGIQIYVPAINLMRNTAPQSGEELAAQMLANGSIKLLQDDYRRETGGRYI